MYGQRKCPKIIPVHLTLLWNIQKYRKINAKHISFVKKVRENLSSSKRRKSYEFVKPLAISIQIAFLEEHFLPIIPFYKREEVNKQK